jgi:TatD DNase family protein
MNSFSVCFKERFFSQCFNLMTPFFDTHCHLDYPDFAGDFAEVLDRAAQAGISRMISIGTDLESSRKAIELADRHESIYAVVGVHPCNAAETVGDIRGPLLELARHPKVVGIGETGLDYYRLPAAGGDEEAALKQKQARLFQQQLEVAAEAGLNCVIHQREAYQDVVNMIRPFTPQVRGVFHCFVDDAAAMREILAMQCLVSFTGIATFKNAATVKDTVAATPMGQFMLETDCPYLAPTPYRGKRCEPAYVKEIAAVIAGIKQCSLEVLSETTCRAACEFFRNLK